MPKNHTVDTKRGKNSAINNGLKGLKSIFYKTKCFFTKNLDFNPFLRKKNNAQHPKYCTIFSEFQSTMKYIIAYLYMIRYIFSFTHSFRLVNNPLIKFIHIYTHSSTIQVKITELSSCFFPLYIKYIQYVVVVVIMFIFRYISSFSLTFFSLVIFYFHQ